MADCPARYNEAMCVLALAWQTHPEYPLLFAGNRDERHARPTLAAGWWPDAPQVLGGRDAEAGGSWLGITRSGRFAVVTNIREPGTPPPPNPPSRGALVADYLTGTLQPAALLSLLQRSGNRYPGFNLLWGQVTDKAKQLFWYANRDKSGRALAPGIYGLSNHLLDTPWPKVQTVKRIMQTQLAATPDSAALFSALADRTPAPDNTLPDTGIGRERERRLSAPCVVDPVYGTRVSTVILISRNGRVQFEERPLTPDGVVGTARQFTFSVEPA